jgi:hypothetical protein
MPMWYSDVRRHPFKPASRLGLGKHTIARLSRVEPCDESFRRPDWSSSDNAGIDSILAIVAAVHHKFDAHDAATALPPACKPEPVQQQQSSHGQSQRGAAALCRNASVGEHKRLQDVANTASGLAQLGWQAGKGAMRAAARLTSSMNAQDVNTVSGLVTLGWNASEEWAGNVAAAVEALLAAPARFSKPGLMLMQLL